MLSKLKIKDLLSAYKPLIFKDLDLTNLRYMDFSGLNLTNVIFDDCYLACSDFTGAYLNEISFQNVNAPNCIFSRTFIRSTEVNNTDFKNAIFSDSEITNSKFRFTKFINSKFTNANIIDSNFQNVNLEACDFNYSYLDKISFENSILRFAIMPEITKEQTVNFINSDLLGTDYEHINSKNNYDIKSPETENRIENKSSTNAKKIVVNFTI